MLRAQADAEARAMRAKGEADAIGMVFKAIHDGNPDQKLLAYQYLQMLPEIAKGDANKLWIVPSEMGKALENLGGLFQPPADSTRTISRPSAPRLRRFRCPELVPLTPRLSVSRNEKRSVTPC